MQGGLWKKQLITSFVKYLTESHKNTIRIGFQVHNPISVQEGCFKADVINPDVINHTRQCTRCSTKEEINSFFCKALYRKL